MDFPLRSIDRTGNSITRGGQDDGTLTLMSSGYMELIISVAKSFMWPKDDEEIARSPRFNPYAICEFPVTFLRLFSLLTNKESLPGSFIVNLACTGIKGITLWPGHPMSVAEGSPITKARLYPANELILDPLELDQSFMPDTLAYKLISEVYGAFVYKPENIPFYTDETGEFTF